MEKTFSFRVRYFCFILTFAFAFPFARPNCDAQSKKPSEVVVATAVSTLDFHGGMVVTTVDAQALRQAAVQRIETCLGEIPDCFAAASATLPTGGNNLIVSTALSYENDQTKFAAQQFNLHFQNNFTLTGALDGPVTSIVHPNCYYLYSEGSNVSLTHVKYRGGNDIQVVGNRYHPNNATTGRATKNYFNKIDYHDFTGCFGNESNRSQVVSDGQNNFSLIYRDRNKEIRSLLLPIFAPGARIISADMTSRYGSGRSNEFLIVNVAWQQSTGDYKSQVFLQNIDVAQTPWQIVGNPIQLTKAKTDHQIQSRFFHSVAIDPAGNFAAFAIPYRLSGVVKSQRLNPDTGEKIGLSHTIFKSSLFEKAHGPYGVNISYIF
jgi:hypothetical protein